MMNLPVLICLVLWPCVIVAVTINKSQDEILDNADGKEVKRDQTPIIFTDNSPGKFQGIQADSLGMNNQAAITPVIGKEAVFKKLASEDPDSTEDSKKLTFGTESNDMSQYDTEEINLVNSHSSPKHRKTQKLVHWLSSEGKADKKITKLPKFKNTKNDNPLMKTNFTSKEVGKSFTIKVSNSTSNHKGKSSSKEMKSRVNTTKKTLFTKGEDSVVKIFDLPDSKITEAADQLPKSAEQLLSDADDVSLTKLHKAGERMTMFYDHDSNAVKKVEQPSDSPGKEIAAKSTGAHDQKINIDEIKGGQIVGGQITGGRIGGGNIYGGEISGGIINGGTIKGGNIRGGHMNGGLIDGGILMDGTVEGGFVHNGTIKGGDIKGGNVTGGVIAGGVILGGHVSSGVVEGGVLKKGGVEGGVLQGGTIDGGILKGGVMDSGQLLGGIVWNGRVTGGTILGGEVLGGEVGEGVVIRGGKINGTVTVGRKRGSQRSIKTPVPNEPAAPVAGMIGGTIPGKISSSSQGNPSGQPNNVNTANANGAILFPPKRPLVAVLSQVPRPTDQTKRTYKPNTVFNPPPPSSPNLRSPVPSNTRQNYVDTRPSYLGRNYATAGYPAPRNAAVNNLASNYANSRTLPRPLAVPIPRSRPGGMNINQFVKQVAGGAQRSTTSSDVELKPDHHWILNEIKNGEVTGIPGRKLVAQGGIRLNRASIGFDGAATFMDGGDYKGTCVSDPTHCPRGLSFEMTIKVNPEATNYRDPRYILDTGASSFNSRGLALYTIDNKLRADVAIRDTAYCLAVPLTTGKWQDVVVTYNRNGALNMYINCKLVATVENDEHCINCHTPGCHDTDENTKLILGRSNNEPKSNFAKFKAGDLSIYERYLTPQDIDKICGFTKQKPSPVSTNFIPTARWKSPILSSSFPRTQPGFLKSAISNPHKNADIAAKVPYFSPWGSWSICSSSCGSGTSVRQRSCIYTHAQSGWQTCHGVTFQAKKCTVKCPGQRHAVKIEPTAAKHKDNMTTSNDKRADQKEKAKTIADSTNVRNATNPEIKPSDKNDNTSKTKISRRNKIGNILKKLGNLLGKL